MSSTSTRIGQGYDVHAIAPGLKMRLCGVDVSSERGFVAHSDGDVAIHALCDALLGALALGDIGHLFPDSSDEFAGIDSTILLRRVISLVREEGWELGNADITIALQAPKIAPLIASMRCRLAEVMQVNESRISVKATTTERLGFVGRGEGCEVWATVCVEKALCEEERLSDIGSVFPARMVREMILPYFETSIVAGFPIPLDNDEKSQSIELLRMLCPHPEASYLIRVQGDSMIDAGIRSGDIVIVDKSNRNPSEKEVAVCEFNGEYTLKRFVKKDGAGWLVPANPDFPKIRISADDEFSVWGVVSYIIHKPQ